MVRENRSNDVTVGGNNLVVPYLYNVAVRSGDANVPLFKPNNAELKSETVVCLRKHWYRIPGLGVF